MEDDPVEETIEEKKDDINDAIQAIREEFEARFNALETSFQSELATLRESFTGHEGRYEHAERKREPDKQPQERHWYLRRVGS